MLKCHHRHACRAGSALLETIVATTVVTIFHSGVHLTNSQVVAQVTRLAETPATLQRQRVPVCELDREYPVETEKTPNA